MAGKRIACAEIANRSAIKDRRAVLLRCCETAEERQNRAQANGRSLADWLHMEIHIQRPYAPQRQACFYSHSMLPRNRSAQDEGGEAATEHVLPTDASADSYHRRRRRLIKDVCFHCTATEHADAMRTATEHSCLLIGLSSSVQRSITESAVLGRTATKHAETMKLLQSIPVV